MQPLSRHVAVIGAGAGGLVAARELRREGHTVVVLEQGDQLGGTWVYNPEVESDPIGLDPDRNRVHSSMYQCLRTNLPREYMGFLDYPFAAKEEGDPRRYPGHREVLNYLNEFARHFGIFETLRFGTQVVFVGLVDGGKWMVKSKTKTTEELYEEIYDAVIVCIGHYTEPRVAHIPGICRKVELPASVNGKDSQKKSKWKGKQTHSHNYRTPDPFRNQVVVVIGGYASAKDISRDIAGVAREVHIASRSVADETIEVKKPGYDNVWLHSMIKSVHEDGSVVFPNGSIVPADTIIHCTGYKYHYPFLETNGIVTVDDNRVGPLYKHIFPPALAPSLSFVGVPWMTAPFPNCELQSKWIAGVLSNRIALPSEKEMMEDVKGFYLSLEASGTPKRYTHNIYKYKDEYTGWLSAQCGCPGYEEWRKQMELAVLKNFIDRPETFQDEWDDDHLVLQAYEQFRKSTINED